MNNKFISVALIAILVIAIGAYTFPKGNTIVERVVGAVTGPDSFFDYVANNDLQKFGQTKPLTTATTTVCAIKSPTATSTLSLGGVKLIVSSTTASVVTIAKATTAFATTTRLSRASVAAGAQITLTVFVASTTGVYGSLGQIHTADETDIIFAPNTFMVVGMEGNIGTFSPTGSCSAEFVRI